MNRILTLAIAGILFTGIGTTGIVNAQATFGRQQAGTFQRGPQGFGFGMAQRGPQGFGFGAAPQGGRQQARGGRQGGGQGFGFGAAPQGGRQGFGMMPQRGFGFGFGPQAAQPRGPQAGPAAGPRGPQAGPAAGPQARGPQTRGPQAQNRGNADKPAKEKKKDKKD